MSPTPQAPDAAPSPDATEQHSGRRALLTRAGPIGLGLGALAALTSTRTEPAHAAPTDDDQAPAPWTNVLDHDLVGDGSTDCSAPLRRLLRELDGPATLHFPAGNYRFRAPASVPAEITLVLDQGAVLAPDTERTLTLDGPITAGPHQVFGGKGKVTGGFATSPVLPQWWGAVGDGKHDDAPAFNAALQLSLTAGAVAIQVPRGDYRIAGRLRIYRNTHLRFDPGATLVRGWAAGFFTNGDNGGSYPGYSGHGSIVIEGGTLDGNVGEFADEYVAMSFGHAEDITIRGLTIRDVIWGHAIEVNACRRVTISDCRFLGYRDAADGSRSFSEAIQLDVPTKLSFPAFGPWDGTPCRDVTIANCHFGPSGTDNTTSWACGVGSHGCIHDVWTSGVRIIDNVFDRTTWYAIRPFKWNDCVITGNVLTDCAGGITHSTPAPDTESSKDKDGVQQGVAQGSARILIADNIISGTSTSAAISAYGRPDAGPEQVQIHGNQIIGTKSNAIHATYCRGLQVSDNMVHQASGHGVRLEQVEGFAVDDNWIDEVSVEKEGASDGINLVGCRAGVVRHNAVRPGGQRYGFAADADCEDVTSSANLLAGASGPYLAESDSTRDQVELYAPSGTRFALTVSDDGELTAAPVE